MVVVIFFLLMYCTFLLLLWMGWNKALEPAHRTGPIDEAMISVIIPLRNEAHNIQALMDSLTSLHYSNYELIVVNDHSEDLTWQTLQEISLARLTVLENNGSGKKKAITRGVQAAKGSIIVTTDGDCVVPPQWLKIINDTFHDQNIKLAFGGVSLSGNRSFFLDLQRIEFSSLIGSGAATAALGIPTLCNGANLGYRKTIFEEVNGYDSNFHIASGDDEFLMRKVRRLYPQGVRFIAAQDALVKTAPASTLRSFFQQRFRWAGKWRHNSSLLARSIALFILLCQACFIAALISLLLAFDPWILTIVIMKMILEGIFLFRVARYLQQRWSWPAFAALQVLYPFYVFFTGLLSNFITPLWKGRP